MTFKPLSDADIAALPADAQAEYLEHLEALYWAEGRKRLETFVARVEIPGTPTKDASEDEGELYSAKLVPAEHHKLIINALQRIVDGEDDDVDGVMIFMPPGSAKSSYASVAAPAWLLGRSKDTSVIVATYGQDLANRFGRRVRHIARSPEFAKIMDSTITGDNQAVDDWSLTNGSTFRAVGIGGGVTGLRGDWIIIDDPVKNREEADSQVIRNKVFDSFNDDLTSRYRPGMRIMLIMCMTGDTPVLMADGTETPLCDIRPGDQIATYDNGAVTSSTVLNWANQGPDKVFEIRMRSGIIVRANARHPFLIEEGGIRKWARTDTLRPGTVILRVIGGNGAASFAPPNAATSKQNVAVCACRTTTSINGIAGTARRLLSILSTGARRVSRTDIRSVQKSMIGWLQSKVAFAPSARGHRHKTCEPIGAENSMTMGTSEGSYAAIATLPLDTAVRWKCCCQPLSTYEIVADEVEAVHDAGVADVFDIQVAGTENFIANGLVSHNTRWHEDDLAGRLLGEDWKGQSGLWRGTDERLWNIINLPMIAEHKDDPLGRQVGEQLWGEYFRKKDFERLQRAAAKGGTAARTWSSLYQQRPAPADGSILLRSYWKKWKDDDPPECDFVWLSYDTAFEEDEENDPSAMTAWGVFPHVSKKSTGEEYNHHHVILLGAWRDWVAAADLADIMEDHYRVMKPDLILIEKRASGTQIIQELKRKRLPVKPWLPKGVKGGKGKVPRAHAIAMMLEQGSVWYVPGAKTEMVLAEAAAFPNGKHDDLTDTMTAALAFARDRFMFRTADDEMDDDELREMIKARHLARKSAILSGGRRLYGGEATGPTRMAQNERRLYGGKSEIDRDEPTIARMTEASRKRHLYGR